MVVTAFFHVQRITPLLQIRGYYRTGGGICQLNFAEGQVW
jgi:hypothetical protein